MVINNQTLVNTDLEQGVSAQDTGLVRLLIFSIAKLTLALPVHRVRKVIKYATMHGSGLSHVNLTHFNDQELTVIDLHQKLFSRSQDELNPDGGYFIVIRSNPNADSDLGEDLLGIRAINTPILMDVGIDQIRTLPNSYRYADTLKIASHVAIIPEGEGSSQTIFLLDLDCLI